jgi:nicotinamide-nucleotide amidase
VRLEVVTVGTELLLGFTPDTNGAYLGRRLAEAGITVVRRTTVPDRPEAIRQAVGDALARTGVVLTTGGLGPTRDDITRPAVAELLARPLRFDPDTWAAIAERFRRLGREPGPANRTQAEVPEGALVLPNRWGTAPGLWLETPAGLVVMLPGVPGELERLLDHEVLPRLAARGAQRVIRSRVVRTTGLPESLVGARVGAIEPELAPVSVAYLPGPEGVDVRLTAWDAAPADADGRLADGVARVEAVLEDHVYGRDRDDLAAVVLEALRARGLTLALAESCTGGLLGARITALPGSSEVFLGGVVCYADRAKTDLLGVSGELLAAHGAVSPEVALALAAGAAARFGADTAIAVTGIAGPGGGTATKPVGTVCFGWVGPAAGREHGQVRFPGGRQEVRQRAAQHGLFGLLRLVRA